MGKTPAVKFKENQWKMFRDAAKLKAASSLANTQDKASSLFYNDFSGAVAGSIATIDTMSTNLTAAVAAGTQAVSVSSIGTLVAGQEVTILDDVNLERPVIASATGTTVTFTAPLVNAYKNGARLCRSSLVEDTVNKVLKFGGWQYPTSSSQSNAVVNAGQSLSNYDLASSGASGSSGSRKIVRTANGNLVGVVYLSSGTFNFYRSTDNGATWSQCCYFTYVSNGDCALAAVGNRVYGLVMSNGWATNVQCVTFDVTTVSNSASLTAAYTVDPSITAAAAGLSLAADSLGNLHAAWTCRTSTFNTSFNIRYSKFNATSQTWAAPTQITSYSATGADLSNPCVVVNNTNNPMIFFVSWNGYLYCTPYTGSFWDANGDSYGRGYTVYYPGSNYLQEWPSAAVAPNGRIWCSWTLQDSSPYASTAVSYSDDGGKTWSTANKLTSGTSGYNQQYSSVTVDKNNIVYVTWSGFDPNISTSYRNLRKAVFDGTSWSAVTTLTNFSSSQQVMYSSAVNDASGDYTKGTPPLIWQDNQGVAAIHYAGNMTVMQTAPVLAEDARYTLSPPYAVSTAVVFIDHDTDPGFSVGAAFTAYTSTESYATMVKNTATLDASTTESQFTLPGGASAAKATLRITATRSSTSLIKNIRSLYGAVLS